MCVYVNKKPTDWWVFNYFVVLFFLQFGLPGPLQLHPFVVFIVDGFMFFF
jgi:hypothetical protein